MKHGKSGVRWWGIHHSAPTFYGDSGGLLIDAKGSFIGINYGFARSEYKILGRSWLRHYFSAAVLPDPEWIKRLIEEDRNCRRDNRYLLLQGRCQYSVDILLSN